MSVFQGALHPQGKSIINSKLKGQGSDVHEYRLLLN